MDSKNNANFDNPSKQLLYIAEQLTNLAKIMDNGDEVKASAGAEINGKNSIEDADQLNIENQAGTAEKTKNKENTENKESTQSAENSAKTENSRKETASREKVQKEKVEKVEAKPIENQSDRQIGGGLNGMFGGFNMKNMPGLGNLFGGMMGGMGLGGGLPGFGGLAGKTPESIEDVKNNPQMMAMLGSLENNPALLNTIAAMSGMDKEQILNSVKALRQNSENADGAEAAEAAAESSSTATGNNPMGNLNLNSLGDLSRLFGGGQPVQNPSAMSGLPNQSAANPMPVNGMNVSPMSVGGSLPLRGTMGGDPLTNLLNQWHWTPLRS